MIVNSVRRREQTENEAVQSTDLRTRRAPGKSPEVPSQTLDDFRAAPLLMLSREHVGITASDLHRQGK